MTFLLGVNKITQFILFQSLQNSINATVTSNTLSWTVWTKFYSSGALNVGAPRIQGFLGNKWTFCRKKIVKYHKNAEKKSKICPLYSRSAR